LSIGAELNRIGIQINQRDQGESLRSLSEDSVPETSPNWWICSDGEDIIVGGTLDEVLQYTGIQPTQIEKTKKLCLQWGHIWFFPGDRGIVTIEADPIKAHQKSERTKCNFLVVAHNPKLAKVYGEE
jgi:hypothetical protein